MYFYFEDDSQISFSITDGEVNFAKVGTHDSEGAGHKENEKLDINNKEEKLATKFLCVVLCSDKSTPAVTVHIELQMLHSACGRKSFQHLMSILQCMYMTLFQNCVLLDQALLRK